MMEKDTFIDYYELLQVHPKAGVDVIKKAYYFLMQQNHPDKGGSEEVAKKINEAYKVLTNIELRKEYDFNRNLKTSEKNTSLEKKETSLEKKTKAENIISKECPIMSSYGTLVSDERGNRVLIIDSDGEITWVYAKAVSPIGKLKNPHFAIFSDKNILITDTGNSRVIEISHKKELLWQFGTGEAGYSEKSLDSPSSALKIPNGNILICDTGNKRVIEVTSFGEIVWQYGDLKDAKMFGKSLLPIMSKTIYAMFTPVSAQRLKNGNTLISDIGNKRIIEVSPDKKIVWQYPSKKLEKDDFLGANFCVNLSNGNILYTFDKLCEINQYGDLTWEYSKNVNDMDINWAYKLQNNQVIINTTRIVRRGINQEIMMIDSYGKLLWRYYYSQYKYF